MISLLRFRLFPSRLTARAQFTTCRGQGRKWISCFSTATFLALACGGAAQTLTCGQVTNGVIGFVGQINTYILSATAGDVIRFTALGTSGGICPDVEVTGPGGAIVGGFGCNDGFSTLRLPDTGIHTVRVRDRGNDQTGAYVIGLSFATPKCTAIALGCGQVVTNTFTNSVQQHTYSISGVAGDVIRLTSYPLAAAAPDIDIFNATGDFLTTIGFNDGFTTLKLNNSGTYTVLVRDRDNDHTGAYVLSLVYATPKCAPIALTCGQVVTNTFTSSVQQHTYSISGVAGDVVRLTSYPLAGAAPDIDIFNATGDYLTTIGFNDGFTTLKLTNTATYTVLVRDRDNDHTGAYVLSLTYITPKCSSIVLNCGQGITNTFTSSVQQHTYVVNGYAGQAIRLIGVGSGVCPDMQVFNPAGVLIGSIGCNDPSSTVILPSTQTYRVVVGERGNDEVGKYSLFLDAIGGCFRLEVGSVVGRTQEVACLPLKTFAGAPAGALNFTLLAPSSLGGVPLSYSNVSLSTGSRFADATITQGTAGTNVQWQVALRTGPVSPLIGDESIGSLCFRGISTQSVFVPFVLQSLTVSNLDGSVPGASAVVGRAVIIADQPLLEAGLSPSQERLVTTYGKANTGYEIRYTNELPYTTSRPWTLGMTNLLPTNMFQTQPLTAPLNTIPNLFLHAKER